jgi:hypothetical protein
MVKFNSDKILSDEEILTEEPIFWQINDLHMETPLLPFKKVREFNQIAGVLSEYFLVGNKARLPEKSGEILTKSYDMYPILRLYDDFGLPYFLISVSRPTNIKKAVEIYNRWSVGKATRYGDIDVGTVDNFEKGQDLYILYIALTDYLMYNSTEEDIINLFKGISHREQNIKKKLVMILTEKVVTTEDLPRSSHNAKILEFHRKKQQRLSHSSKSSS